MPQPHENYFFTSESVSMGHPDKVADQVSDAVLDALLTHDPMARVACETFVTTGLVMVGGEITVHNTKAELALANIENDIRETVRKIGYAGDIGMKFDADNCGVIRTIHGQSADISQGVTEGAGVDKEQGAGDQASSGTTSAMAGSSPLPLLSESTPTRSPCRTLLLHWHSTRRWTAPSRCTSRPTSAAKTVWPVRPTPATSCPTLPRSTS